MPVLRVFVTAPPDAARSDAWALFDGAGRVVERGSGPPAHWPHADRREAVVAADALRIVSLALPPLPPSRIRSAAAYAIEDRLATPARDVAIGIGTRREDGRVVAIAVARDFADALARAGFARAIAEPELASAPRDAWRWCESESSGFVRTGDGAAFPASRAAAADELPPEIAHALLQAAREGTAPSEVVVDRETGPQPFAAWGRQTGVPFRAGAPWRWYEADAARFAGAIDLLHATRETPASASPPRFAAALGLVGAALLLHVVATLATFGWSEVTIDNLARDLVPVAHRLGATAATPPTAAADIARLHAAARHRAGLPAPGDAMPLLARAAPALAALPHGALKTATFSAGAWTLELGALDDATLAALVERLRAAGLSPLYARTSAGVRARVTP
jgi:type II secretion system protein L